MSNRLGGRCAAIASVVFLIGYARLVDHCHAEPSAVDSENAWVSEAEALIGKLSRLADSLPATETRLGDPEWGARWTEARTSIVEADKLLWQLWLTTGMAPLLDKEDESVRRYIEKNVSAYRKYVSEHASLTSEAITRLGIKNSIDAFGSPLWCMAFRYLKAKAGLATDGGFDRLTNPPRFMINWPVNDVAYARFAAGASLWIAANREAMVWDPAGKRFHARKGGYVGEFDLTTILGPEDSSPYGSQVLKFSKKIRDAESGGQKKEEHGSDRR